LITTRKFSALPTHHRLGELTFDQKGDNRILSRDRIIVENFFGRWKTSFGICHEVYRGEIKLLGTIIRITIAITNWHIRQHPLLRVT
jgi:hypothetical protein